MDPDEGNNSVLEGSAAGTLKRSSKKRKVEAEAGAKGAGLLAQVGRCKKPTRRIPRGSEVGFGRVGLKEWNIPYPDIGPPPRLTLSTSISTSFLPRSIPGLYTTTGSDVSAVKAEPVNDPTYDSTLDSIWSSIIITAILYAHKARKNNVGAVRPRTWLEWDDSDGILLQGQENRGESCLPFERRTIWRNEMNAVDERRRGWRMLGWNWKRKEPRQRRELEFLIKQAELYSYFVGKRLRSSCLFPSYHQRN